MLFTLVIPTYNRPEDLQRAVASILAQTVLPGELLIIDDASLSEEILGEFSVACSDREIVFTYYKKDHRLERRGLAESKNRALELAQHDVIFIDDDIVLDSDFVEYIQRTWKTFDEENMIGVGGMISNNRTQGVMERVFHRLFGLCSDVPWDVTSTGFQVWDESLDEVAPVQYVHGGLCALKKELAQTLRFPVFEGGRTGLEDVDFAWRAKQAGYFFVMQPKARALHLHSQTSRETVFAEGVKESRNRRDMYHRLGEGGRILFAWNMLGWILRQFLSGHFVKGLGMIRGLV
jgi:GT2 family glycosyltransferase